MPIKKSYTACLVFQDEESEDNFQKILGQKVLKDHPLVKFITTSNDAFLEGKCQDTYDFTCLLFGDNLDVDELELKNELLTYYGHVPVTWWFVSADSKDKTDEEKEPIFKYFSSNFAKYLLRLEPDMIDYKNAGEAAQGFAESMEKMIEKYDQKYEEDVKPAFSKFDKDSSGAIDKGEL